MQNSVENSSQHARASVARASRSHSRFNHDSALQAQKANLMASYSTMNTIPAAASETPLLSRDIKVNAKTLLGGAAAAAFVLGAAAATVVAPSAPTAPAAFENAVGAPQDRLPATKSYAKKTSILRRRPVHLRRNSFIP